MYYNGNTIIGEIVYKKIV